MFKRVLDGKFKKPLLLARLTHVRLYALSSEEIRRQRTLACRIRRAKNRTVIILRERYLQAFCDLRYRFRFLCSKSKSALKSLAGHWKTHTGSIDFGSCFRRASDGSLQIEPRTAGCMSGIDIELAKYPWMDLVDYQIFLDGFHAGAQYRAGISDLGS